MRVKVTRRGGLAGVALRGEVETTTLSPKKARAAEAALKTLRARAPAGVPRHPDSFRYDVDFDGDSATMDESEVTDDLRPLIDAAMEKSELL